MPQNNPLYALQAPPSSRTSRRALALSATAILAVGVTAAAAPTPRASRAHAMAVPVTSTEIRQSAAITVEADKAYMISLPQPAKTVFVANPDVADVQVNDHHRIVIFGKRPGTTTVYITSVGGQVGSYTVTVQRQAEKIVAAVKAQAPDADVHVASAPGGVTVSGAVATPREAEAVKSTVQQYVGDRDTVNMNVGVTGGTQVNLQVRVAEVSRSVARDFGFNWNAIVNNGSTAFGFATGREILSGGFGSFTRDPTDSLGSIGLGYRSNGGSANLNAVIDALQSQGLVSILAEPNLTATSGETASFLAGGEFLVPIAQQLNAITVEWKRFGVALDFTPTVLDDGRISIKVRPEVSQLSDAGAVTINNIKIPGIVVRRAETTVELGSGESFAIAGLFQNNASTNVKQYPWLGDIPILGPLFRSSTFTHDQSELVIIVTPYIVRPVSKTAQLRSPTEGLRFANELEQVVYGEVVAKPGAPARPHLSGPAGFMLEDKR